MSMASSSSQVDNLEVAPEFGESCNLNPQSDSVHDVLTQFRNKSKNLSSIYDSIIGKVCFQTCNQFSNQKPFLNFSVGFHERASICQSLWPLMTSLGLNYFVTLCLFPGIESEIISCKMGSWMPVCLMAVFNLTDLIGKVSKRLLFRINQD